MTSLASQLDRPAERRLRRPRGARRRRRRSGSPARQRQRTRRSLLIALMVSRASRRPSRSSQRFGVSGFVTGTAGRRRSSIYGALPFIYGTMLTSAIALPDRGADRRPDRAARHRVPAAADCADPSPSPSTCWRPSRRSSGACGVCWCSCRSSDRSSRRSPASIGQVIPFLGPVRHPGPSYFAAGVIVAIMIVPIIAARHAGGLRGDPSPPARGGPGARRDALGRHPRRSSSRSGGPASLAADHPRPRPGDRRDDRRHARDRQRADDRPLDLLARVHPRERHRQRVQRGDRGAPCGVAHRPRRGAARDRADRQRRSASTSGSGSRRGPAGGR